MSKFNTLSDRFRFRVIIIPFFFREVFALYRISYIWYTALGAVVAISVAGILTLIFGGNDPKSVPPELLTPFVRRRIHGNEVPSPQKQTTVTTNKINESNF